MNRFSCRRPSRFHYSRSVIFFLAVSVLGLQFCGFNILGVGKKASYATGNSRTASRHLLSAAEWEKCDFEIKHKRNYSNPDSWTSTGDAKIWVALYAVLILVVFVALAIICDDFFVPSLEAITEKLDLSEDVAGATFMAAGSSAPELFTSIAGVTVESDVGVGTIVGSAVFNLLGICALSAAFAGQELKLDWRPLTRDATYYGISIVAFILFAWDGKFELYESIVLLIMYFLYILLMKFNPKLMELMSRCGQSRSKVAPSDVTACTTSEGDDQGKRAFHHAKESNSGTSKNNNDLEVKFSDGGDDETIPCIVCPCLPPVQADVPLKHGSGCISILRLILSWILFIVSFPFVILFTWTIPNCSTPETKKYYLFSFVMSIVWIAGLSFVMVTLVGRTGCILEVDKFTMGLVVVAIGTSIPDALSSVLVARDGYGDMAVSNAIGSNVFDIDLGIGLPFVISSIIRNFEPVRLLSPQQQLDYDNGDIIMIPHVKFGFILLVVLFASLIVFSLAKFRLNKYLGATFVFFYIVFVGYAYIQDLYCDNDC